MSAGKKYRRMSYDEVILYVSPEDRSPQQTVIDHGLLGSRRFFARSAASGGADGFDDFGVLVERAASDDVDEITKRERSTTV